MADKDIVRNPDLELTDYEVGETRTPPTHSSLYCPTCDRKFPSVAAAERHVRIKVKNHGGTLLPKSDFDPNRHILICTDDSCCYAAPSLAQMESHSRNFKHNIRLPPGIVMMYRTNIMEQGEVNCDKCLRTFSRTSERNRHQKTCIVSIIIYQYLH